MSANEPLTAAHVAPLRAGIALHNGLNSEIGLAVYLSALSPLAYMRLDDAKTVREVIDAATTQIQPLRGSCYEFGREAADGLEGTIATFREQHADILGS